MKHSAASTTPRYHFPPSLAAVGHSTVCTRTTKGTLSGDPSVARHTLRSSTIKNRNWDQFFSGRPGLGFSPPAVVPNSTRRVSRSLCVHCTPPAKRRRRLQMVVPTLSHCAFLRALAYDMWSVRCRRWKPMVRKRNLWCGVRSSAKCYLPRVHVAHPYSSSITSAFSMRNFRANGAVGGINPFFLH